MKQKMKNISLISIIVAAGIISFAITSKSNVNAETLADVEEIVEKEEIQAEPVKEKEVVVVKKVVYVDKIKDEEQPVNEVVNVTPSEEKTPINLADSANLKVVE